MLDRLGQASPCHGRQASPSSGVERMRPSLRKRTTNDWWLCKTRIGPEPGAAREHDGSCASTTRKLHRVCGTAMPRCDVEPCAEDPKARTLPSGVQCSRGWTALQKAAFGRTHDDLARSIPRQMPSAATPGALERRAAEPTKRAAARAILHASGASAFSRTRTCGCSSRPAYQQIARLGERLDALHRAIRHVGGALPSRLTIVGSAPFETR